MTGEIDLNAFQHKAFLANDVAQKGYDIVDIGDTIIAPLSIYNNKKRFLLLKRLKDGDVIRNSRAILQTADAP